MSGQDEILKDVIYNINKTNHELNRLKILLKEDKRQLRHKNIIIAFLFIIILCLSVFSGYLLINSKNKTPPTASVYYKDSNSAIVSNNKLDNDSQMNIDQKRINKKEAHQKTCFK